MSTQPGGYTGYTGAAGPTGDPFNYPGAETSNNAALPIYTGRILGYGQTGGGSEFYGRPAEGVVVPHTSMGYDPNPGWGILNPLTAFRAATGQPVGHTTSDTTYTETSGPIMDYRATGTNGRGTPNWETKSLGEFIASFANTARPQMERLQRQLVAAGRLNPQSMVYGAYDQSTRNAVAEVALEVAVQQQATQRPSVTFDSQIQNDIVAQKQAIAAGLVPDTTPFTGSRSRTDVQHTDATTGEAIIVKAMSDLLGRAPTAQEVAQYQATLSGAESGNPVHTTTQYKAGIETGSTQTGGLTSQGAGLLAQQQVQNDPEFLAFQGATTYIGALRNLMGALTPAGG